MYFCYRKIFLWDQSIQKQINTILKKTSLLTAVVQRAAALFMRGLIRTEASGGANAVAASRALMELLPSWSAVPGRVWQHPPTAWRWPESNNADSDLPTAASTHTSRDAWERAALPLLALRCCVNQAMHGVPHSSVVLRQLFLDGVLLPPSRCLKCPEQCLFFRWNTGLFTPKAIHFYYLKKTFVDQSIQKNI